MISPQQGEEQKGKCGARNELGLSAEYKTQLDFKRTFKSWWKFVASFRPLLPPNDIIHLFLDFIASEKHGMKSGNTL